MSTVTIRQPAVTAEFDTRPLRDVPSAELIDQLKQMLPFVTTWPETLRMDFAAITEEDQALLGFVIAAVLYDVLPWSFLETMKTRPRWEHWEALRAAYDTDAGRQAVLAKRATLTLEVAE